MVDKMSTITNIISEIDSIQTALSTLRSNVLDFLKSEEPSVRKKEGENRRLHLQHLNQLSILPRPLNLYLSVRSFHLFQLLFLHFLQLPPFSQLAHLQPPLRLVHLQPPLRLVSLQSSF